MAYSDSDDDYGTSDDDEDDEGGETLAELLERTRRKQAAQREVEAEGMAHDSQGSTVLPAPAEPPADEIIAIIREQEKPKPVLMQRFALSENQADAILDLKLRHLARLEQHRIQAEQEELAAERQKLELLLGSKARLKTLIKRELMADAEAFGDDRRSPIVVRQEAKALSERDLLTTEPCISNERNVLGLFVHVFIKKKQQTKQEPTIPLEK